jgi:uncharacterized protein
MPKLKFFTLWIAVAVIALFIIQSLTPNFTNLFLLNQDSWFQPWRFITSIFLHGSVTHLVSNLFALLFFGLILEKLIGSEKFLGVFFISGIGANLVAINFYSSSLGASGAIMGIIGALAIIRPLMGVWAFGMILPMSVAAILWVVIDAMGIFIPSNVGHIAHLSGILFGTIFGLIFRFNSQKRNKNNSIKIPEHILRRWETLYLGN